MVTDVKALEALSYEQLEQAVLDHYGLEVKHHTVQLDKVGVPAHVIECGTGIPTLLLHGGDGEGWNFAPLMAELKDVLHMYAVDRPAFGMTRPFDYDSVTDLRQHALDFTLGVMNGLGLDSVLMVGASFSGIFATAVAIEQPARVRGLVYPSYAAGLTSNLSRGARMRSMFKSRAKAAYTATGRTTAGQREMHERLWAVPPDAVPDVYYAARSAGSQLPGCEDAWVHLRNRVIGPMGMRKDVTFTDELHSIKQPVLLMWGDQERNDADAMRRAATNFPDCRYVLMPGVGHFPQLDHPEWTARLIREFLPSLPSA